QFLLIPATVLYALLAGFGLALVTYLLCKRNVFHYAMSFLMTTSNALLMSYALGFLAPAARAPFFLFYVYIVLHPALLLGMLNGAVGVFLVDASYLGMVWLTRGRYPETSLGMEIAKLVFFTAVSLMLMADLQKNLDRIKRIREVLGRAEGGDLTPRTADHEKDEVHFLGVSLDALLENEIKIIGMITESVQALVGMSEQISSTASQLTASITEIVGTTHQLTDNVKAQQSEMSSTLQTAGSLGEASRQAMEQSGQAQQFSGAVSETAEGAVGQSDAVGRDIALISQRHRALAEQVRQFHETAAAISRSVDAINAISSQINVLSFNALIEATNAGEHGRGFSVVADEIQKLARTTQASANEIGKMTGAINDSLTAISASTEEVNRAIGSGSIEITAAAEALRTIAAKVSDLAGAVRGINEMTAREGTDVERIVQQVSLANGLSRDNAAAAERILAALEQQSAASQEFSAMSQELVAVSSNLEGMVRTFKVS
ncbi:MAG TPA: methyl-accepting chemotaxis protein, partial [Candidatus Edwardsbacteria bacterium]|nr:methyl-accepting chemotaxis protein [Candidatus Edwardsbacteria bacterium]